MASLANHDPAIFCGDKVSFDLRHAAWNLTSDDIGNADRELDRFAGDAVNELPSIEELVKRYQTGATLDDLAVLCGDTPYRIRRALVAAGVAIRPPGPLPSTAAEDPRGRGVCAIRRPLEPDFAATLSLQGEVKAKRYSSAFVLASFPC
jgi:hypothetical protein